MAETRENALRAVEMLTGCERGALTQCPRYETSRPDVVRAMRLYRAQQGGGLSFDADPPAAIVAAAETIGASDARRMDREREERERERG